MTYKLTIKDKDKFIRTFSEAFLYNDFPYGYLIPEINRRKVCIEELFKIEFERYFNHSQIIATSPECESIIIYGPRNIMDEVGNYPINETLSFLKMFFKGNFKLSEAYIISKNYRKTLSEIEKLKLPNDIYYIGYIGTLPNFRGKGLATKLMNVAIEAANNDKKDIFFENYERNNVKFYERFGFKLIGDDFYKFDYGLQMGIMIRKYEDNKINNEDSKKIEEDIK